MNKTEYIQWLDEQKWHIQKDEAELYGVEKPTDKKWDEMVEAIAEAKFMVDSPDGGIFAPEEEVLEAEEIVPEPEEEEVAIAEPDSNSDEELRFNYVRQGVTLNCQHCGYEIRVGFNNEKICPVSHPKCPRPSPNEV